MECVNLLGQGRPVSQIPLDYSLGGCLLPIKYGMRRLAKYNCLQPGWLSPSYQIWNASTYLGQGRPVAKYNWLQPGDRLLPIKYEMRQPSSPG
ncbi:hypothetical protein CEXT_147781 [Caerostris extrusa]|uniref:Uncharacterized protein n=1 Tax=Caerostris extrusa TaxID=172846 RepID=A0AAV4PJ73_CAEEX|nr:hypothetical protein CEXT_147781 [Caerostris extrusa]